MVARKPKVFRKWKKRQPSPSPIRRLIRGIVFLPLVYLLLERVFLFPFEDTTLSGYLDVEKVAVTTTIKKKDTKQIPLAAVLSSTDTPWKSRKSLEALTQPFRVTDSSLRCPTKREISIAGYRHLGTVTAAETTSKSATAFQRKIPKLLHQQGTTRCVSSVEYDQMEAWAKQLSTDKDGGREWSMFFHTEDAMTRLFRSIIAVEGEEKYSTHSNLSRIGRGFPHLGQILRNCVDNGSLSKRLLWRFLCLYAYGGMYVDLESSLPSTYDNNAKAILRDSYETVLLWTTVEGSLQEKDRSGNKISQSVLGIDPNIIAVSPGHPLMYYAVQHALIDVITDGYWGEHVDDQINKSSEYIVATNILKRALADFLTEKNSSTRLDQSTMKVKTYYGTGDASVTILDASKVGFSNVYELMKIKPFSSEGRDFDGKRGASLDRSRGTSSSCFFKSLVDASVPQTT